MLDSTKTKSILHTENSSKIKPDIKYLLNLDRRFRNCQVDSRIWQCVNSGTRDVRFPMREYKHGFLFHALGNISNKQDRHIHSYEIVIH